MTDEKKTPSLEEIQRSFFSKCQLHQNGYRGDYMPCPHCDYLCFGSNGYGECNGDLDSQGSCERNYIYEITTGARDINKPLWNPPKTPSWLKVGQWIGATKDIYAIGEIVGVNGTVIEVDWIVNGEPIGEQFDVTCATQVLAFVPVKFRPYTYEEGKGLLGKVIEFYYKNGNKCAKLVDCIGDNEGHVLVDGYDQKFIIEQYSVFIDGLPFGVPVVDEELLSNP